MIVIALPEAYIGQNTPDGGGLKPFKGEIDFDGLKIPYRVANSIMFFVPTLPVDEYGNTMRAITNKELLVNYAANYNVNGKNILSAADYAALSDSDLKNLDVGVFPTTPPWLNE